ncbi:hypothetical protein EKN07_04800 [Actinobaculum sp. 352]|nr:hypothetical protein EKN07_04800 [Actinobaculum sp. 352]
MELRQLVHDLMPLDPHSDEFSDADADLLELMGHDSSTALRVLLIELYEGCVSVPQELMDRAWYFSKDCAYLEEDCRDLM